MRKDINQVKQELLVLAVERGDENNAASGHEIGAFSLPYKTGRDPGGAD